MQLIQKTYHSQSQWLFFFFNLYLLVSVFISPFSTSYMNPWIHLQLFTLNHVKWLFTSGNLSSHNQSLKCALIPPPPHSPAILWLVSFHSLPSFRKCQSRKLKKHNKNNPFFLMLMTIFFSSLKYRWKKDCQS